MGWWWLGIGVGLAALGGLAYWAFIITEGAYLGARVVAWTYDLTAHKYDQIKQFNPEHDAWLISGPLVNKLNPVRRPLVLDVATGTGRLPLSLLSRPPFQGHVVGLDLSRRMLEHARVNLIAFEDRCTLVHHDAQHLPFADETFDAVCCLEALEFMPSPHKVLTEMARVLRPGGIFLVTNRVNWESRLMPGKAFAKPRFRAMLQGLGLERVEFRLWQVYYDLIFARKSGISLPEGQLPEQAQAHLDPRWIV